LLPATRTEPENADALSGTPSRHTKNHQTPPPAGDRPCHQLFSTPLQPMKNPFFAFICLVIACSVLGSCRTTRGLGKDIQHLGTKIEQKAAENTNY